MDIALARRIVQEVGTRIVASSDQLTALDQAIGDGDHGLNMKRGFEAVLAELDTLAATDAAALCSAVGRTLVMKVGGASGPLYGTLFMQLGKAWPAQSDASAWGPCLQSAVAAVAARGKSHTGQKTMLDSLSASADDMDRLQQKGLLGEAEAGLLRLDLAWLTQGVQSKRPTEMKMATCYLPMASMSGAATSMRRLRDRLPLLEKLAASERIHRDVVNKVLAQIETDLASLEKTEVTDRLSPVDRKKAEEVRKSVAVLVDKLKAAGARSE